MLEYEYNPISHRLQFELPFFALKLPAGQGVQDGAPLSAKKPGWQEVHVLARLVENVP